MATNWKIGDRVQATGTVVGFEGLDDDIDNVEVRWDVLDGSDTDPASLQWGHDPIALMKIMPTEPPIGSAVESGGVVYVRTKDGWYAPEVDFTCQWDEFSYDVTVLKDTA